MIITKPTNHENVSPDMCDISKLTRKQRKAITRDKIIAAAIHLLFEEGPASFSMNRITKRAGVSQPAFYKHFTNLEALTPLLVKIYFERFCGPSLNQKLHGLVCHDAKSMRNFLHNLNSAELIRLTKQGVRAINLSLALHSCQSPIGAAIKEHARLDRKKLVSSLIATGFLPNERAFIDSFNMAWDAREVLLPQYAKQCIQGEYQATEQVVELLTDLVWRPVGNIVQDKSTAAAALRSMI